MGIYIVLDEFFRDVHYILIAHYIPIFLLGGHGLYY